MSDERTLHPDSPPKLPGNYKICDADGDIIYWGDSINLYYTWCERVRSHSFPGNGTFEYSLADSVEPDACDGICHMSDY